MSAGAIATDIFAVVAMIMGFAMVFRQDMVRRLWRSGHLADDPSPRKREDDPAHYVLSIFGMMLLAFGLTIFGFVTAYGLLS